MGSSDRQAHPRATLWVGGLHGCLVLHAPGGRPGEPSAEPTAGGMGPGVLPPGLRDMLQSHPTTAVGNGMAVATRDSAQPALLNCRLAVVLPVGWALTLTAKCLGQLGGIRGVRSAALPRDLPRRDARLQ